MLNKKIMFFVFLIFNLIIVSNFALAVYGYALSNIKVYNEIDGQPGIQLIPNRYGIINDPDDTELDYGAYYYIEFDVTNKGDDFPTQSYFASLSDNPLPITYPLGEGGFYYSPRFNFPGGDPDPTMHIRVKATITNTICSGLKNLKLYTYPGAYNLIPIGSLINFSSGHDCPKIKRMNKGWVNNIHPAILNQSEDQSSRFMSPFFDMQNIDSQNFVGTYNIKIQSSFGQLDSNGNNIYTLCSTGPRPLYNPDNPTEEFLPSGKTIQLTLDPYTNPLDPQCPVETYGYASIEIKDSTGKIMPTFPINSYPLIYNVDVPALLTTTEPALDKYYYAPGEDVKIYISNQNYKVYTSSPQYAGSTIPTDSVYHIWVVNPTTGAILTHNGLGEPGKIAMPITQNIPPTSINRFGTDTRGGSTSSYYLIGPALFTFDPSQEVPERIRVYMQMNNTAGNVIQNAILSVANSCGGRCLYKPYYKDITLKPIQICETISDKGCSCDPSIENSVYKVTCNLFRASPGFSLNTKYGGRFIFNSKLEPELQKRFIKLTTTPTETIGALDFSHSIQFDTVPNPDVSAVDRTYTFEFNCDLDGDGFLADFCETDSTKIDCDDDKVNDPVGCPADPILCTSETSKCAICINPSATDTICDGIDNNCKNGIDEGYVVIETHCGIADTPCANNIGQLVCNNGIETDTCVSDAGATEESCDILSTLSDNIDNDCDGLKDAGEGLNCDSYCDVDGDKYTPKLECSFLPSYSYGDCDDNNPNINPGALEKCNIVNSVGIDDDCDDKINEGCDDDNDGYCNENLDPQAILRNEFGVILQATNDVCINGIDDCVDSVNYCFYTGDPFTYCSSNPNLINPGATEVCNDVDDDCDGTPDDEINTPYYLDSDGDGYGDPSKSVSDCKQPTGYVSLSEDCNDQVRAINPGATEVCDSIDNDCDGSIDEGCSCVVGTIESCGYNNMGACKLGTRTCTDTGWGICDDALYPTDETCNGVDDDCDGDIGEDIGEITKPIYYKDNDGDGFGDLIPILSCYQYPTYVTTTGDCDDNPSGEGSYNPDTGEYIFDPACYTQICDDTGYCSGYKLDCILLTSGQCAICNHPDAIEICDDGIDNNCNGVVDSDCICANGQTQDCYPNENSGCKLINGVYTCEGICEAGEQTCIGGQWSSCTGYTIPSLNGEICNNLDDDCDGTIDNGVLNTYYEDSDNDGFGVITDPIQACEKPDDYSLFLGDCDDDSSDDSLYSDVMVDIDGDGNYAEHINPSAGEIPCNNIDENCNSADDNGVDSDGDSFSIEGGSCGEVDCDDRDSSTYPGAPEKCGDEIDNNCDGSIDEGCCTNIGVVQNCYTGISGCTNVDGTYTCNGECKSGTQICLDTYKWGSCVGEVLSITDICGDSIDQDCSGADEVCLTCIPEGEYKVVGLNTPECCEGLTSISNMEYHPAIPASGLMPGSPEACVLLSGNTICAKCGDGACGTGENKCNCPEDCATPPTTCPLLTPISPDFCSDKNQVIIPSGLDENGCQLTPICCTKTNVCEVRENEIDDNCDERVDILPVVQLANKLTEANLATNLEILSSTPNSITLILKSKTGDPVQDATVCIGICDINTMSYADQYIYNGVTFETPFGITDSDGKVTFFYTIVSGTETQMTFNTLSDGTTPELSVPISFSKT